MSNPVPPALEELLRIAQRRHPSLGPQDALAAEFSVSRQAVSRWMCQGYLPLDRAIDAARRFGVEAYPLVAGRLEAMRTERPA